jgi:gluconolactonase
MHPLTIYQSRINDVIHTNFELQVLDPNCLFSEGPVWNKKEEFYLFSDITSNVINKINPGKVKEIYLQRSGCTHEAVAELPRMMGSNGLTYDTEGNLIICQHGNHAVAKYSGSEIEPFITTYNGKQLNSPNDIIASENGAIFFSDPPYGLADQKINAEKYQPVAGFYCWKEGMLKMFWDGYQYPNGLCLSPDQKSLFTCSSKPFEAAILEFDVETLQLKRTIIKETSDGIKCDNRGHLFLCNKDGIIIINAEGEKLGLIRLPTQPANMCWGGKNGRDVVITARENIFYIPELLKA